MNLYSRDTLLTIWHICHILKIERKLEITMDKFEVEFYTKASGEKPAKDFILGLDVKMRAKLYRKDYLERVKENE